MAAGRTFFGLDGTEIKVLLRSELKSDLFARMEAYVDRAIRVVWTWKLELASYPSEHVIRVTLGGEASGTGRQICERVLADVKRHLDLDTQFSRHLTFPKVTWDSRMQMDAFGQAVDPALTVTRPVPMAADPSRDPSLVDLRGQRRDPPLARDLRAEVGVTDPREATIAQMQDQMQKMWRIIDVLSHESATVAAVDVVPERAIAQSEQKPVGWQNYTGTGLPIEGGAMPSPGRVFAEASGGGAPVGALQREIPLEHLEIGRSHPGLAQGGLGAPDAVRRDAGLVVPQPQRVQGHIVDFPASTF